MAKKFKGANSKVTAANEKKAQARAEKDKQQAEQKAAQLAKEWSKGAKDTTKQQEQEQKKQEREERRREAQRQLEEENKHLPASRGAQRKALPPKPAEEYAARTIDDALDLFDNLEEHAGRDPKSTSAAALVDRHPERRAKAAYREFEDREMARLKQENPGLRMSQLKERLKKLWQKSPENPLNQAQVAHNARQEDIQKVVESQRQETMDRLRV